MSNAANTFLLDGIAVPFAPGQSIIDAALTAGIYIPHLCHRPGLSPHGSCKLCTVEIDGRSASACTTPAATGMNVASNTKALNEVRKSITQMLFVEGNHLCPACEKSGDCTLQAVAYHLGMLDGHYPQFYPRRELDASHPAVILDRNRCILCALCVRTSREVDGKNVFAISGRGIKGRIIANSPSGKLGDTDLSIDDLAAHICPVGAILIKDHGYETPIGQRKYDGHSVSEPELEPVILAKGAHHDE